MANVKMVRLFSGELVLAKMSVTDFGFAENYRSIEMQDPIKVIVMPSKTPGAHPTIALMPWNEFSTDKVVTINTNYIVSIETPIDQFVSQYLSVLSGLVLPQNSGNSIIL